MKLSDKGVKFIQDFEGIKLNAYRDLVGVLTVGFGHTGTDVKEGMTITKERANELFMQDIGNFVNGVNSLVKACTQGEFNALVSFAYNLGLRSLSSSTLLRKLNDGDVHGAAEEFVKWNMAGGHIVGGLTRRRLAERDLFLSQD